MFHFITSFIYRHSYITSTCLLLFSVISFIFSSSATFTKWHDFFFLILFAHILPSVFFTLPNFWRHLHSSSNLSTLLLSLYLPFSPYTPLFLAFFLDLKILLRAVTNCSISCFCRFAFPFNKCLNTCSPQPSILIQTWSAFFLQFRKWLAWEVLQRLSPRTLTLPLILHQWLQDVNKDF